MSKVKVLFVCMGNICRSPTAHGVFLDTLQRAGLTDSIHVDSAGTHSYHIGKAPDSRAQASARQRGIDLSRLRARKVTPEDISEYDYVLAMDEDNLFNLKQISPPHHLTKIRLFMDFAPHMKTREVPDPYYGGASGFERVLDLIEAASEGLLADIQQRHLK